MMNLSFSYLVDIVFNENPTRGELLTVVFCLAVFWCICLETGRHVIANIVKDKKWLRDAKIREYEREGKKMCENLGFPLSEDDFVELMSKDWGWMQLVLLQHFISGSLCVPSVLNLCDKSTASSLACLSVLGEMGWEIQDLITMWCRRLFAENGKKLVPDIMLIVMPMHHSMTTLLGIPAILRYRHLKIFHWLSFDLQFASTLCMGIAEYTKLLDITKPNQLFQFTFLSFLGFIISVWTRVIHFLYLLVRFAQVWIEEGNYSFLAIGVVIAVVFSTFSFFVVVEPFYKRLKKFIQKSWAYRSLPKDASPAQRRSSVIDLQNAAMDLAMVAANEGFAAEVSALFENRKKPSRRETMPASVMQRQLRLSAYTKPTKSASTGMAILNNPAIRKQFEELDPSTEFKVKDKDA